VWRESTVMGCVKRDDIWVMRGFCCGRACWMMGIHSRPGYTPGYVGQQKFGACNPLLWRWDASDVVWVMGVTHPG